MKLYVGLTFMFMLFAFVSVLENEKLFADEYRLIGEWLTSCDPYDLYLGCNLNDERPFVYPTGIAIDSFSSMYIADLWTHTIQKFTSDGKFVTKWGTRGSGNGEFIAPAGIAIDSFDNVYVADLIGSTVQKFTSDGKFVAEWGTRGSGNGEFITPAGIAIDSFDNVYVADRVRNDIQKFTSDGEFVTKWGSQGTDYDKFQGLKGIAVDNQGYVYIVDQINNRIQKFTTDGKFVTMWGSICETESGSPNLWLYPCPNPGDYEFYYPDGGIATDSEANIYVVDQLNNRIQKFTSDGKFITELELPVYGQHMPSWSRLGHSSVTVDLNGRLYTSVLNDKILIFDEFPDLA